MTQKTISGIKWRPEEEHLVQLMLSSSTVEQIAVAITERHEAKTSGFPTLRSEEAIKAKCKREGWTPDNKQSWGTTNPVKDAWNKIRDLQSKYKDQSIEQAPLFDGVVARKILSLSDIHFPLGREDLLQQVIDDHLDADIVVINGDLLEGYIFSTFAKSKVIAAIDEYNIAFEFIRMLSQLFPKVVLVEGNHDARPTKFLGSVGVDKAASSILQPNLMARMANGERLDPSGMLIEKLDFNNVYFEKRQSWFVKIGKTLFIHPHTRGGSGPGHTVLEMGKKLLLAYPEGEVDSVVCGHTHQIYKGVVNNKLFIEQGCLAGMLTYLWKANNTHSKNYQNGYALIYQDAEGNTDFNRSGPIYLGQCIPVKKETIF